MFEIILNRWRGTGDMFSIANVTITGTHLYALYCGLLFGFVSGSVYVGLVTVVGFIAGESFGWGKWVGGLCYPEAVNLTECYEDREGYNFPYIHYIANAIVKERNNYSWYCRVALGIRGVMWSALLYSGLVSFGLISFEVYVSSIVVWGIGFPLACFISTLPIISDNSRIYESRFISITSKWENQEIVYGAMQGLVFWLVVFL